MPISITQPGSLASGAFGQFGVNADTNPGLLAAFKNSPNAITTSGWNAFRGSNTILRGGWSSNELNRGTFLKNQFMPRSFGRMSSIYGVDNSNAPRIGKAYRRKGDKRPYSPFNFLGSDEGKLNPNALLNFINKKRNPGAETQRYFSPGFMSRQTAASKISRGVKVDPDRVMSNLGKLDPNIGKMMADAPTDFASSLSKGELAQFTAASMQGTVSLKASGLFSYLQTGAPSEKVLAKFGTNETGQAAKEAFQKWGSDAADKFAQGNLSKVGSKLVYKAGQGEAEKFGFSAVRAGMADAAVEGGSLASGEIAGLAVAQFIPVVGEVVDAIAAAKLVFDVGKMAAGAASSAMQTAKDAAISFKGDIGKPIMGMGYKDNSVAATSRSRGVAAIQNSRLNARSALGSEAAPMFAHFG